MNKKAAVVVSFICLLSAAAPRLHAAPADQDQAQRLAGALLTAMPAATRLELAEKAQMTRARELILSAAFEQARQQALRRGAQAISKTGPPSWK